MVTVARLTEQKPRPAGTKCLHTFVSAPPVLGGGEGETAGDGLSPSHPLKADTRVGTLFSLIFRRFGAIHASMSFKHSKRTRLCCACIVENRLRKRVRQALLFKLRPGGEQSEADEPPEQTPGGLHRGGGWTRGQI